MAVVTEAMAKSKGVGTVVRVVARAAAATAMVREETSRWVEALEVAACSAEMAAVAKSVGSEVVGGEDWAVTEAVRTIGERLAAVIAVAVTTALRG